MMDLKFFKCEVCGNTVAFIEDHGVPLVCCGKKMKELVPGEIDAAVEKHVPVIDVDGNKVKVSIGDVEHPMTEPHYIEWVVLQTEKGNQRKVLTPCDEPVVNFMVTDDDKVLRAYAYCNLHGLWKADYVNTAVPAVKEHVICKCKNVSYADIETALHDGQQLNDVLKAFEEVQHATACSTGCGGCHDKIMDVISELMHK